MSAAIASALMAAVLLFWLLATTGDGRPLLSAVLRDLSKVLYCAADAYAAMHFRMVLAFRMAKTAVLAGAAEFRRAWRSTEPMNQEGR